MKILQNQFLIFSDASYDPATQRGVGASLIYSQGTTPPFEIEVKRMDGENIARLELLTALWALQEWKLRFTKFIQNEKAKLRLIVDCKAIVNLQSRRRRLEERDFLSRKTQLPLANADLY